MHLPPRLRTGVAAAVLIGLSLAAACGPRRPPSVPDAMLGEFRQFDAKLRAALTAGEPGRVEHALQSWTLEQPPLAQEGDLYASVLTKAPALDPGSAWDRVGEVFTARFPNHPDVWLGHQVQLRAALPAMDVEAAVDHWEAMAEGPGSARLDNARRIAQTLWEMEQRTAAVAWAAQAPPDEEAGRFWQLLFHRAWACCGTADVDAGSPVHRLLALKQALRAGDRGTIADHAAWGRRFADRQGVAGGWPDFFEWAEGLGTAPPAEGSEIAALLPLSGRSQGLGRRVLQGLVGCLQPGEALDVADSKGRAALAGSLLHDHATHGRLFGPLRTVELAATAPQMLRRGQVSVTPNPNPLGPVPLTAPIWSVGLTPEDQAHALAKLVTEQGWRAVSVLAPNDDYGRRFLDVLWAEVIGRGGWFTGVEQFEPGASDYGDAIRSLVGLDRFTAEEEKELKKEGLEPTPILDFDVLLIAGNSSQLALMPAQLAYYDVYDVRVAGDAGWHSPAIGEIAGDYVEGVMFVDLAAGKQPTGAAATYRDCVTTTVPEPGPLDAVVFEGLSVLRALEGAESPYQDWGPIDGISGDLRPLPKHTVRRSLTVWQWTRRGIVPWDGRDPLDRFAPPEAPPESPLETPPQSPAGATVPGMR